MVHDRGGSPQTEGTEDANEGIPYHMEEQDNNAQHEREILSAVRTILGRAELLDVSFLCKDGLVRASRTLLASGSKYFSKLLYGDMKERSMGTIPLPTAKAGAVQIVVNYLHGHPIRWSSDDRCWEDLVEAYCLASQYQITNLCEGILLLLRRVTQARELGDLLNAATSRDAEEVLSAALKVMNEVLVFDSTSFLGWSKESITYCLENAITETMVVEAVLSAASDNCSSVSKQKNSHILPEIGNSATKKLEDAVGSENVILRSCQEAGETLKKSDARIRRSLSREDLREILEYHINLAFVDALFVTRRIEPLEVLRPEVLYAVYRVHAVCFAGGWPIKSLFMIPWRSLCPRVSFTAVKVGQDGICKAYTEVLIPSLWAYSRSWFFVSEKLVQRVRCTSLGTGSNPARMNLPLLSGKHIWMVRSLEHCKDFGLGVSSSTNSVRLLCGRWGNRYLSVARRSTDEKSKTVRQELSQEVLRSSGLETFSKCGSVFVILDMNKKSLSFADELARYITCEGEYPEALVDLPCDTALHPVLYMTNPGCAEIEWIQSSPRAQPTCPGLRESQCES